jgi:hypothetical protein
VLLLRRVDPQLVLSNLRKVFGQLFTDFGKNLSHIMVDGALDVSAEFHNQLIVSSAILDFVIKQSPTALLDQFQVFFDGNQILVDVIDLCLPLNRVEPGLKNLLLFGLFK